MNALAFLAGSTTADHVDNIIFLLVVFVVLIAALALAEGAWKLFVWGARRYYHYAEAREEGRRAAAARRLRQPPLDSPGAVAEFLQRGARR